MNEYNYFRQWPSAMTMGSPEMVDMAFVMSSYNPLNNGVTIPNPTLASYEKAKVRADDVVVCMDLNTGKLLWENRGPIGRIQTEDRWGNTAPITVDGVIVLPDHGSDLYGIVRLCTGNVMHAAEGGMKGEAAKNKIPCGLTALLALATGLC